MDSDRIASSFDAITAYDAGVDQMLHYPGVVLEEVRGLVYGAMFTRGGDDLKNSAVFIGGSSVAQGESMLEEAKAAFFGPVRVSLMLDANGCNTTAAAAVAKIRSTGDVTNKKIAVLAGTGPVGLRVAGLLGRDGAQVMLSSRSLARSEAACVSIQERFGVKVTPAEAADPQGTRPRARWRLCSPLLWRGGGCVGARVDLGGPSDCALAGGCECCSSPRY